MGKNAESAGKDIVKLIKFIFVLTMVIIVAVMVWNLFSKGSILKGCTPKEKTAIVSSSKLEKVLQINELSTYKVTFNGVTAVRDDNDKVLYYVAYNAKVGVGIDMEKIKVETADTDVDNKELIITIPEIQIMDADVDPGSLDYIFENKSANTNDVFKTAYPACREDAESECKTNGMLFELARENAVNTVNALVQPVLEQYEGYSIKIVYEGGYAYE